MQTHFVKSLNCITSQHWLIVYAEKCRLHDLLMYLSDSDSAGCGHCQATSCFLLSTNIVVPLHVSLSVQRVKVQCISSHWDAICPGAYLSSAPPLVLLFLHTSVSFFSRQGNGVAPLPPPALAVGQADAPFWEKNRDSKRCVENKT